MREFAMSSDNLTPLERDLLDYLARHGPLTVNLGNALEVAQSFGTTTQKLAEAKNQLVAVGYATSASDAFTNGTSVTHITPAGREALHKKSAVKNSFWRWLWPF